MNPSLHPPSGADPGQGGPEPRERPGQHAGGAGAAPAILPQGLLLLAASSFCLFAGAGFVAQAEAVLFSPLGYALLTGGGYANAAGAVLLIAGAYWLFAAVKLFGGGQKTPLAPHCYVGGNALLFLGVLCFASAVGRGHFAPDPAGGGLAAPVLGTAVAAAGLYWLWTATRLLGGDGRPTADLQNFVSGHVMLAAGVAGFSATAAVFDVAGAMSDLRNLIVYAAGGFIFAASFFWFLTAIRRLRGKPVPSLTRFVLGNAIIVIGLAGALWWVPDIYQFGSFGDFIFDLLLWKTFFVVGVAMMGAGAYLATCEDTQQQQVAKLLAELRKEKRSG